MKKSIRNQILGGEEASNFPLSPHSIRKLIDPIIYQKPQRLYFLEKEKSLFGMESLSLAFYSMAEV